MYECQYVFVVDKYTPFFVRPVREKFEAEGYKMLPYTDDSKGTWKVCFSGAKEECLKVRKEVAQIIHVIETGVGTKMFKWFEVRVDGGTWKGHPRYKK